MSFVKFGIISQTKKLSIPIGIDPYLVVKDLSKEVRAAEKCSRKYDEKVNI